MRADGVPGLPILRVHAGGVRSACENAHDRRYHDYGLIQAGHAAATA